MVSYAAQLRLRITMSYSVIRNFFPEFFGLLQIVRDLPGPSVFDGGWGSGPMWLAQK